MTKFFIALRRALPEELHKGWDRGPKTGHKYIKRERHFVGGKMSWIYWYADDMQRTATREAIDPEGKHQHHLIAKIGEVHENLKNKLVLAIDATTAVFKGLFGYGGKAARTKVTQSAEWTAEHHEPAIKEEAGGLVEKRSPNARIQKALELIPDHIKEMLETSEPKEGDSGKFFGVSEFALEPSNWNYAGCMHANGKVEIAGGAVRPDQGPGYFGSDRTRLEEVVIHELGHCVETSLDQSDPKLIETWKAVHDRAISFVSNYARRGNPLQPHWVWREDFAESFACALTHPKELALKAPDQYDWMREHVLPELLDREAIAKTPDEDLRWWEGKAPTVVTHALNQLVLDSPARQFAPYYSEKDQFYTVHVQGRVVYLRFGPTDRETEAGWERMPATIDPETGLPRYEGVLASSRFKGGALKEIYDEKGRSLTSQQAYLYLGQDDAKVTEYVQSVVGKEPGNTFGAKEAEKEASKRDKESEKDKESGAESGGADLAGGTHSLGYKIYTALGFAAEHTLEGERHRVGAAKAKGKPTELERHEWAPVEITAAEFGAKSGTFKFGEMREAAVQDRVLRENGLVRTAYDPATGTEKPLLSSKLYEQRNPDGSYTRIRVAEAPAFSTGQVIWLPETKTKADADGVERTTTEWVTVKLKEGDSTDPQVLAKQYNTTAAILLEKNNCYARGQIMDPLLAALLNPGNVVQVNDAATLQSLMRAAAEQDVPRRAWVSIQGKASSGVAAMAVAHMEVEWDGAGPPRVVGNYWRRRLGGAAGDIVRIDQLINKADQIKFEVVKERKPKAMPVVPGAVVWINDDGRRVMATYVKEVTLPDGKKVHAVEPLKKQGAGVQTTLRNVLKVSAISEADIVGKPGRVRRLVQPMEHEVLLYADEVSVGSGPNTSSGVIKILLPKDGSVGFDELVRVPGVMQLGTPDDKLVPEMQIAVEDIPEMRKQLGGFVMDSRVRQLLKDASDREAMRLAMRDREELVHANDIVDVNSESGNMNPNGVLRGLVMGDAGIQPGPHRVKALQKLAKSGGRLLAAHFMGTGKSALSIMGDQMMRNLVGEDGKAHPNQLKKKTLWVVPPNTLENIFQEIKRFTDVPPVVIGTDAVPGALQIPQRPARKPSESDSAYTTRLLLNWKEKLAADPKYWNPFADANQRVCVGFEYFLQHEETLRATGLFDGMVIDEGHRTAGDSKINAAVMRWSPDMKMFMALTGTPIKNTLTGLPRLIRMISGGQIDLGTDEAFAKRYLLPSAVLLAEGVKNPPRTDLNPARAAELAAKLQPIMDIATTADVKGKSMPAVLLDENQPAHMTGMQATMYRAAMASLTEKEREMLAMTAALGLDEQAFLSDGARRKISIARSIANNPAFKAADLRKMLQYTSTAAVYDKKGKPVGTKEVDRPFQLPSYAEATEKKKLSGWGGNWPSAKDVDAKRVEDGYYQALQKYSAHLFGVDYATLEGKPLDKKLLAEIKAGTHITATGQAWAREVANPDYGPEGLLCRGKLDLATGDVSPLSYLWHDDAGNAVRKEIPVGTAFVRDPNHEALGIFYHQKDWNYTGRFDADKGEGEGEIEGEEQTKGESERGKKRKAGDQGPIDAELSLSSVHRREERAMFDAVAVHGNAKTDAMENKIRAVLAGTTGDPNPEKAQFIHFGNRVSSSVRTMEAKMRSMGLQDVNEALGHPDVSSDADKNLNPTKYYVTYAGVNATIGEREINSEIFRRMQDQFGGDTGTSCFVARTLYGTDKDGGPKIGKVYEPWGAAQRKKIAATFMDASGAVDKNGKPLGLEVAMRVRAVAGKGGKLVHQYVYASDLDRKTKNTVAGLELRIRSAVGPQKEAHEKALQAALSKHWVERSALTDHQIHVFNNTQHMVASDAANVGLNWPSPYVTMYDSLFSPMDEWQRITRAARMLPPAVGPKLRPIVERIGAHIEAQEAANNARPDYTPASALGLVQEAIEALPDAERNALNTLPGGSPAQVVEAYFASRALKKIDGMRDKVATAMKVDGYWPDPVRRDQVMAQLQGATNPIARKALKDQLDGMFIKPVAVLDSDVVSHIIRTKLQPFERSMMVARRYLVDVTRLNTSVDMPVMVTVKTADGEEFTSHAVDDNGDPIYQTETPNKAEKSQGTQRRAKMVPYEVAMGIFSNAQSHTTAYDFVEMTPHSLASTSVLDPVKAAKEEETGDYLHNTGIHYAQGLPPPTPYVPKARKTKKAKGDVVEKAMRFFVRQAPALRLVINRR
jgi:hypothetical protein